MRQITVKDLKGLINENKPVFLLDVREEHEHKQFNIGGKLIPLSEVTSHAGQIPKDEPVVVYCRKGVRSQIAIQRLEQKFGFTNLINLRGGLEKWES